MYKGLFMSGSMANIEQNNILCDFEKTFDQEVKGTDTVLH